MKFVALIDIDGTTAHSQWREGMQDEAGWSAYQAAAKDDKPIRNVVALVRALHRAGWQCIGLSERSEAYRSMTMAWLLANDVPFDDLLLRPNGDFTPAPDLKVRMAKERYGDDLRETITCVFDDRDDVIDLFMAEGITGIQVRAVKEYLGSEK